MAAYFIVRAEVHDPVAYQAYASRSPDVLARYGGRHIARGGKVLSFERPAETRRVVIAEFADFDSAERCYRSPGETVMPISVRPDQREIRGPWALRSA